MANKAEKNGDALVIKKLEDICFPEESWSLESVRSTLERSDIFYEIFYKVLDHNSDGSPIGYYIAAISFDEAELYRIAVLPEYRSRGYGGLLMRDFLEKCPDDVSKFFLEVRESNKAAVGLYEKTGFKAVSRRRNYYGSEDAVIYLLESGE